MNNVFTPITFDTDIEMILAAIDLVEIPEDMGKVVVTSYLNSKKELKKLEINVKVSDQDIEVALEEKDEDTLEFTIKTQGVKVFSGSIYIKEDGDDVTMKLSLSLAELINVELNVKATTKLDAKLEKIDLSDSISADDLTESDTEKLEKIIETKGFKKLLEDIEKIDLSSMTELFGEASL